MHDERLQILDADALVDADKNATALAELNDVIVVGSIDDIPRIFLALLDKPHALGFALSALLPSSFTVLRLHLLSHFPRTPDDFDTSSFAWRAFVELASLAYFSASNSSIPDNASELEHRRATTLLVVHAPAIIVSSAEAPLFSVPGAYGELVAGFSGEYGTNTFDPNAVDNLYYEDEYEDELPPPPEPIFGVRIKQSQRERKNLKKQQRQKQQQQEKPRNGRHQDQPQRLPTSVPDRAQLDRALTVLDELPPTSVPAATALRARILSRCHTALEELLECIRRPELAPAFKAVYIPNKTMAVIPAPPAEQNCDLTETSTLQLGSASEVDALDSSDLVASDIPFPAVQPLRAALHFDSATGFGPWRVLIAGRAQGALREARRKDRVKFDIYVKKIKELSHGHFSDDNQKRLTGQNVPVPIYEAKMTRDSRLVYQIDCIQEYDTSVERQAIRIFGFYPHTKLDHRLWDSLGVQLAVRRGKQYARRCRFRASPYVDGDSVVPPHEWPFELRDVEREEREMGTSGEGGVQDDKAKVEGAYLEEMHALLVLDKFVEISQPLMDSIMLDREFHGLIQLSPYEQEIVHHDHACYVLGRSGTGKTTTMLIKMIGIENAWRQVAAPDAGRPRQLFVTQSRVLADKVEAAFVNMLESARGSTATGGVDSDIAARRRRVDEAGLVDRDEVAGGGREDLPRRFSELSDAHFPMFVTFDKLSTLLEADLDVDVIVRAETHSSASAVDGTGLFGVTGSSEATGQGMLQRWQSFVSYDLFRHEYWPHFPQPLTKSLDPALVFSEFMGVIKSSEQTVLQSTEATNDSDERGRYFLDAPAYFALSERSQATFASKRREIYALFEAYLRMKRKRGDRDAADRTHVLLRTIEASGLKGQKVDYMYVDEVQDNLLIDAMLLRLVCLNPEGLFWAGDTAQTISVGSSFRFNDLKAFLHRVEDSLRARMVHRSIPEPRSFQLSTNFRSHGGIVHTASSIVKLITRFWPYALDILAEERATVDGVKPVFFTGEDADNVKYSFIGDSGAHIEFGAEQCILVRNDAARDRLREQVGDIGVILTLYESKGLEFNDVLLLHFFEDSTVDVSQWRVVLNALESSQRNGTSAPTFDESRHAGVCSELKFLYVAVTRARKNLWILDSSERGGPIRTYWESLGLIQHSTRTSEADFSRLAAASTPEEWAVTARALFDNKRWRQAMHAYERANMPREKAVASAYYLREQARKTPAAKSSARGASDPRRLAYLAAAEEFIGCAKTARLERREYFRIAGDLFYTIEDYRHAGDAYTEAHKFDDAARTYRKAGLFDKAVGVLKTHKDSMNPNVAETLLNVCKLYYFKQHDLKRAAELFDNIDDELEFAEEYDFDLARAEILVKQGRFSEAADIHVQEGRDMQAIGLYLREAEFNSASLTKAKDGILDLLWQQLSFGAVPNPSNAESSASLRETFDLASQLATLESMKDRADNSRRDLDAFVAIWKGDLVTLRNIGEALLSTNKLLALLCLDHAFRSTSTLLEASGKEAVAVLHCYHSYARLMHELIFNGQPWESPNLRRLFRIASTDEGGIQLADQTFLHQCCMRYDHPDLTTSTPLLLETPAFVKLYRRSLVERLRLSIESINARCLNIRAIKPCQNVTIGYCDPSDHCPYEHVLDQEWFNLSLRFHLLQGFILSIHRVIVKMTTSAPSESPQILVRTWLERLESVLYPIHYAFGSTISINLSLIPELSRGMALIKECTRAYLYDLSPYGSHIAPKSEFINTFIRLMTFGFFFDHTAIRSYLSHAQFVTGSKASYLMRDSSLRAGRYIVHDLIDFFKGNGQYSIESGILFTWHIVENRLTIDIGTLCTLMDTLCSSMVFARRLGAKSPTLHEITLPRSWIVTRLENIGVLQGKRTRLGITFIRAAGELLKLLHANPGTANYITYKSKPIREAHARVRTIAIGRLCRCICLFGYNTNNPIWRDAIVKAVTSLKSHGIAHNHYAQYVNASDWARMARVVTSTMTGSSLDDMVLLVKSGKPAPSAANTRLRRITYETVDDIFKALRIKGDAPAKLRADAPAFVPAALRTESSIPQNISVEDTKEEEQDIEAIMESLPASSSGEEMSLEAVEERTRAARTFSIYYQKKLRSRQKQALQGVSATRAQCINTCRERVAQIEWAVSSPMYRKVFLGPVPHILTCIDELVKKMVSEKKRLYTRMRKEEHGALESVMASQTRIRNCNKELKGMKETFDPDSAMHREKDITLLKNLVIRLREIAEEYGQLKKLEFDLNIALKAIVQEKKLFSESQTERPIRPELNISDL